MFVYIDLFYPGRAYTLLAVCRNIVITFLHQLLKSLFLERSGLLDKTTGNSFWFHPVKYVVTENGQHDVTPQRPARCHARI